MTSVSRDGFQGSAPKDEKMTNDEWAMTHEIRSLNVQSRAVRPTHCANVRALMGAHLSIKPSLVIGNWTWVTPSPSWIIPGQLQPIVRDSDAFWKLWFLARMHDLALDV